MESCKKEIYLDNAATTRAFDEVGERVRDCLCRSYGNPSSLHGKGLEAEHIMRESIQVLADILKVPRESILLTSGGTESDNLAVLGAAQARRRKGRHIITSYLEHPAVLAPMQQLSEQGYEITYIKPDSRGVLHEDDVTDAVRDDTVLVSVMAVNNEIGSVQPVSAIAHKCKEKNPNVLIHCDAVQAFGKIPIFPRRQGIDLLSCSSHKIHGPKGVGALYVADPRMIRPILYGGGQQRDLRPGTENVAGIAGFALAARMVTDQMDQTEAHMRSLKELLIKGIASIEETHVHGSDFDPMWGAASIVSASFRGVSAEVLLHALEDKEIYVSSGSACSSNHPRVSDVLQAIGAAESDLGSTIRFSFSALNTEEEIRDTIRALKELVPVLKRFTRK